MPTLDTTVNHVSLGQQVSETLLLLLGKIRPDVGMPAQGKFPPVAVTLPCGNDAPFAGQVRFSVQAGFDDPAMRYFDVQVETPGGKSYASVGYPFAGSKTDLIRDLEAETLNPTVILETIRRTCETLRDADKA